MPESLSVWLYIVLIALLFLLILYQLQGRHGAKAAAPDTEPDELDKLEARHREAERTRRAPLGWQDPDGDARGQDMDRLRGYVADDPGLGVIAIVLIALSQALGELFSRGKR